MARSQRERFWIRPIKAGGPPPTGLHHSQGPFGGVNAQALQQKDSLDHFVVGH
jgi:hypothetical protein